MKSSLKVGIKVFFCLLIFSCARTKEKKSEIIIVDKKGGFIGINQRIRIYSDSYLLFEDFKENYVKMIKIKREDFEKIKELISRVKLRNIKEEIAPDDVYYFIDIKGKGSYGIGRLSLDKKREYKNIKDLIDIIENYLKKRR